MDKYLKKQIIIAIIFFLIAGLLVFGIYFLLLKPAPSCFDKIQNQGEEGVDCGGPCIPCEQLQLRQIQTLLVKYVQAEQNFYDVVAKIKNPNFNYGVPSLSYTFNFYDSQNQLISSVKDSSFILPTQIKYLVASRIKLNKTPLKVTLTFNKINWQKIKDSVINLPIIDKNYKLTTDGIGFSQLSGKVINKTNYNFQRIEIKGVLLDSSNNVTAINKTEINDVFSGETRDFKFFWSKPFAGEVADSDIIADTNLFSKENFIQPPAKELEKFQQ